MPNPNIRYEGTEGDDSFRGGSHNDDILGFGGDDRLVGAGGNDLILGGTGDDLLYGRLGNDRIKGGGGDDFVSGGRGNDHLSGGRKNDTVLGGAGNDHLKGGIGDDYLDGGKGNDHLLVRDSDTVVVGKGHDTIGIQGANPPTEGLVTVIGFTNACASFNFGSFDAVYHEGSNTWTVGGMTIQSGDGHSLAPPSA